MKNPLYDIKRFNIIAGDQGFVLGLVDKVIEAVEKPRGTEIMVFLLMMGDKTPTPVCLSEVVYSTALLKAVSVHPAANIRDRQGSVDLMWSRYPPGSWRQGQGVYRLHLARGRQLPGALEWGSARPQARIDLRFQGG